MKRVLTSTLVIGTFLGMVACSSDNKLTSKIDQSATTAGDGGDGNGSVPLIPGLTPECQAIYRAIGGAAQAMTGASDTEQAKAVFNSLVDAVPSELKGDATVFAQAYGAYLDLLVKYDGDPSKAMSDPKVVAALEQLNTPDVQQASDKLTAYMDTSCSTGS